MAIGKHLSDLNPDGTSVGQSATDKISFYGATPVVRPALTNYAALSVLTATVGGYGFSTSLQHANMIALANALRAALVTLGLVTT